MTIDELIVEGRAKLAAVNLMPLLAEDLGRVVEFQLGSQWRQENAALICWLLNHAPVLLDALEAVQRPPLGYIVGYLDDDEEDGELFRRWTDSLITDRGVADRRLAEAMASGEPWQLLELRKMQP